MPPAAESSVLRRNPTAAPLRVLLVTERLMRGGLQEVLVLIAGGLRARGHDVTCFVSQPIEPDNPYLEALRGAGIPVVQGYAGTQRAARWLTLSRIVFGVLSPLLLLLAIIDAVVRRRSAGRSIRGVHGRLRGLVAVWVGEDAEYFLNGLLPLAQLTALALRKRTQVVHVFFPERVHRLQRWALLMRLPLIYSDHTPYEREWLPPTQSVRKALPHLDGVTVLDGPTAERVRQVYGARGLVLVAPQPVRHVLPSGEPSNGTDFVIGCLARFDAHKGLDVLLRAMVRVRAYLPSAQLWLAGEGGQRAALLALRHELGLDSAMRIDPWLSGQRKVDFWSTIDVLVLPSLAEGIPLAILEAMAAGKAVVATRVGAVSAAVEHESTGLLVEPRDVDGLAEALIVLGRDPERRAQMGRVGRQRVSEHFELNVAVQSIEGLYYAVRERNSPARIQPGLNREALDSVARRH
jgi:glycosyltransferase involved in cell wall biosynthesis